jgi:hypothetical protein
MTEHKLHVKTDDSISLNVRITRIDGLKFDISASTGRIFTASFSSADIAEITRDEGFELSAEMVFEVFTSTVCRALYSTVNEPDSDMHSVTLDIDLAISAGTLAIKTISYPFLIPERNLVAERLNAADKKIANLEKQIELLRANTLRLNEYLAVCFKVFTSNGMKFLSR